MTADLAISAAYVCATCKARKKKCDKALPRCGYCTKKSLTCRYVAPSSSTANGHRGQHSHDTRGGPDVGASSITSTVKPLLLREPSTLEANLYREVLQLIAGTGEFVDDITARYFQTGLHRFLPVISRKRFQRNLITLGGVPPAGFSVLLLAICLSVSTLTSPTSGAASVQQPEALHLAAKSLCYQVQGACGPSVHLIQARLLLAVHEYRQRRPQEAFESIAGCARMAYAARLHRIFDSGNGSNDVTMADADSAYEMDAEDPDAVELQRREAANTWWGIVINERVFFAEVSVTDQPLVSIIPNGGACCLPTEPGVLDQMGSPVSHTRNLEATPWHPVSDVKATSVGPFGRAAQAAWIIDEVIEACKVYNLDDSKLPRLGLLDKTIQELLGSIINQQCAAIDVYVCEAGALAFKALFMLHGQILKYTRSRGSPSSNLSSSLPESLKQTELEQWAMQSQDTLNAAARMVADSVEAHASNGSTHPPSYYYVIDMALKHIYSVSAWEEDSDLKSIEGRLRGRYAQNNKTC